MAKSSGKFKAAVRHPVRWWKGAGQPGEALRPWEGGIQMVAEILKAVMDRFVGLRDWLFIGSAPGKVNPNWKSVAQLVTTLWDGANDPVIGAYMDRKRYGAGIHRWVMRFNAVYSPINILLQMFKFGLSPMQRVIQWTIMGFAGSVVSTANAVSEAKIWAGITPHSAQRGVLQLCKSIGRQIASPIASIVTVLMSFQEVLGLNDYQIITVSALIIAPLSILGRWLPSHALQRVDFNAAAEGKAPETQPTLRESFAVVRHNRWFLMTTALKFVTMLSPGTDEKYFYRFLMPRIKIRGKEADGLWLYNLKGTIIGIPAMLLQPFALKFIKLFGGNLNMKRVNAITLIVTSVGKYLIGYKTIPRILLMYVLELLQQIVDKWDPVADGVIQYQMLDYVELKTGLRSEGMTLAVSGFLDKMIRQNSEMLIGNAFLKWTGFPGADFPLEQQPDKFLKSIWPLLQFKQFLTGAAWLGGLLWFRFPMDPAQMEADLIERRKLEQKIKDEAKV
ncbi:MAG: MFS transporter [Oscillospiraceae bacterium]|nr:MFS transporter [Oscillospiraceae bacterium]